MLEMANAGFFIFAVAIIIFYSGELVWRERDAQLNQVLDAFPLQRWVLFCSKLLALMLVQVVIVLLIMASGLTVQMAQGYLSLRIQPLFPRAVPEPADRLWILCVLAMFVQTIVNNKYLGHFVMVLYIVATIALPPAGFQDHLYRFGQTPPGHLLRHQRLWAVSPAVIWFRLYWAIAAVLLAIVTNLLWVRGTESNWRVRMHLAAARFSRATMAGAMFRLPATLAAVGGYIFYNTHVLNPYRNAFQVDEARAQYEKKYAVLALPQPRITDVTAQVDVLSGNSARVAMRGTMWLENKTSSDIDQVADHNLASRPGAVAETAHQDQ